MSEKASSVIDHGDGVGPERPGGNRRSTRKYKLHFRASCLYAATRLEENGQVTAQLLRPGSREQGQDRASGIETPLTAER